MERSKPNKLDPSTLTKILERGLSLTVEEMQLLQDLEPNDARFPHLLFIFDAYDNTIQAALENVLKGRGTKKSLLC